MRKERESTQLDYFIHPIPAAAMFLMALNDHWLKSHWPSWFTGKLSDFLGVFYFPLLVVALVCLFRNTLVRKRRTTYITRKKLGGAMALTALLMAMVKISPTIALFVEESFSKWLFRIRIVADPTDLIALSSLFLTYRFARPFIKRGPKARSEVDVLETT